MSPLGYSSDGEVPVYVRTDPATREFSLYGLGSNRGE